MGRRLPRRRGTLSGRLRLPLWLNRLLLWRHRLPLWHHKLPLWRNRLPLWRKKGDSKNMIQLDSTKTNDS